MYANSLKFELETLSDWFTVETTSFKLWQKNSPKYYVKKIFLEGYRIINKTNFDFLDRVYLKALHNLIKIFIKLFPLQRCPGSFVS